MRQHGLQSPLDPHQVASWIVFFVLVSGVYAFYMPFVEDAGVRWSLVTIYTILVVAMIILDLYTSYLNPSDPGLSGATDGEFFCGLCQASVARSSKHCRACDRCVEGFDHHCKWLNNCVGARNYWHFFGLISSTVSLLVLQLAWGLWLFIRSFTEKEEMRARVADKYGKSVAYGGWQAALAIYMALLVTSVVMLGELLFFHIVLISKGMTTYDYIIAQRDSKLSGPPPRSGNGLKACRSGRVADATTARRRVKVGLNPCAAMRTHKPKRGPASWDASKGQPLASGLPASSSTPSPTGKSGLDGPDSSAVASKDGLRLTSDKASTSGSMQEMVARAVAEQTMLTQSNLREAALLRRASGAGPGAGSFGSPGCVPECSNTASGGGAGGGADAAREFTPLVHGKAMATAQRGSPPPMLPGDGLLGGYHQQPQTQHRMGALGSPGGAVAGPGPGSVGGVLSRAGSPSGYDAAGGACGRHLGGHPASPGGQQGSSGSLPTTPVPLSRPNSLPPLRNVSSLPLGSTPAGHLYPGKLPPAGSGGARRELMVAPE